MNKPTFTQGPYHVQFLSESEKLPYMVFDDNIAAIARVHSEKDARLIASAPELFKALKAIYEIDVPDAEWSPTLEKCFGVALDAIAKVEGEK